MSVMVASRSWPIGGICWPGRAEPAAPVKRLNWYAGAAVAIVLGADLFFADLTGKD